MKHLILLTFFIAPFALLAQDATTTIQPESASAKQAQAQLLEGDLKLKEKKYEDALLHYQEALTLNKDLICVHAYRANVYFKMNDKEKACAEVRKANDMKCNRPEVETWLKKCNKK